MNHALTAPTKRPTEPRDSGRIAEALGADIVEPVEDAVARGAIPHDPREHATPDAGGPS